MWIMQEISLTGHRHQLVYQETIQYILKQFQFENKRNVHRCFRSEMHQNFVYINVLPHRTSIKIRLEQPGDKKRVLADMITTKSRPLEVLITTMYELHFRNKFDIVDVRLKIQLADLNFKLY